METALAAHNLAMSGVLETPPTTGRSAWTMAGEQQLPPAVGARKSRRRRRHGRSGRGAFKPLRRLHRTRPQMLKVASRDCTAEGVGSAPMGSSHGPCPIPTRNCRQELCCAARHIPGPIRKRSVLLTPLGRPPAAPCNHLPPASDDFPPARVNDVGQASLRPSSVSEHRPELMRHRRAEGRTLS